MKGQSGQRAEETEKKWSKHDQIPKENVLEQEENDQNSSDTFYLSPVI
jgi:hypothetical protein